MTHTPYNPFYITHKKNNKAFLSSKPVPKLMETLQHVFVTRVH